MPPSECAQRGRDKSRLRLLLIDLPALGKELDHVCCQIANHINQIRHPVLLTRIGSAVDLPKYPSVLAALSWELHPERVA